MERSRLPGISELMKRELDSVVSRFRKLRGVSAAMRPAGGRKKRDRRFAEKRGLRAARGGEKSDQFIY